MVKVVIASHARHDEAIQSLMILAHFFNGYCRFLTNCHSPLQGLRNDDIYCFSMVYVASYPLFGLYSELR